MARATRYGLVLALGQALAACASSPPPASASAEQALDALRRADAKALEPFLTREARSRWSERELVELLQAEAREHEARAQEVKGKRTDDAWIYRGQWHPVDGSVLSFRRESDLAYRCEAGPWPLLPAQTAVDALLQLRAALVAQRRGVWGSLMALDARERWRGELDELIDALARPEELVGFPEAERIVVSLPAGREVVLMQQEGTWVIVEWK